MNEWLHVVKEWCTAQIFAVPFEHRTTKKYGQQLPEPQWTPMGCGLQISRTRTLTIRTIWFAEATRKRAFNLVARAYSCISIEDLCSFVGMSASDVIDGMCVCLSVFL